MGRDRNVTISVTDSSQAGGDDGRMNACCPHRRRLVPRLAALALGTALLLAPRPANSLETFGWWRNYDPIYVLGYAPLWWPATAYDPVNGLDWLTNSPVNAPNLGNNLMEPIAASRVASGGSLLLNSNGLLWACGRDDFNFGAEFGMSRPFPAALDGKVWQVTYGGTAGPVVDSIIGMAQPVKAATEHQAVLRADGRALLWGRVVFGQNWAPIGAGAGSLQSVISAKTTHANPVSEQQDIKQVAVGASGSTFLLTGGGKVLSFGSIGFSRPDYLGRVAATNYLDPSPVDFSLGGTQVAPSMKQVDAGLAFAASLDVHGRVWTWGANDNGQLGHGTVGLNQTSRPKPVVDALGNELKGVKQIACTQTAGYALLSDGTVWGWGQNGFGQLGINPNGGDYPFAQWTGLTSATSIWTNQWGVCSLKSDGTVWGLGDDGVSRALAGGGWQVTYNTPYRLFSAWTPNPQMWPPNNSSVLTGTGGILIRSTGIPHQAGAFLGAAEFFLLASPKAPAQKLTSQDFAFQNIPAHRFRKYVTGMVHYEGDPLPEQDRETTATYTGSAGAYTIAIDSFGNLWSAGWEHDPDQALGDGPLIAEWNQFGQSGPKPFQNITGHLPPSGQFVDVDTFMGKTVALTVDGEVYSFGFNPYANKVFFADYTPAPMSAYEPTLVSLSGITPGERVIKLRQGWDHTLALTDAGHVFAMGGWDNGSNGRATGATVGWPLNQHAGNWVQIMRPGQVPLSGVIDIATANDTCLALAGDGQVYGWGSYSSKVLNGATPSNNTGNRHLAKLLVHPDLVGVKSIAMSGTPSDIHYVDPSTNDFGMNDTTCFALRTDGRVVSWGSNISRQTGQGSGFNGGLAQGFVQVQGGQDLQNVKEIAAGGRFAWALSANGKVFAWGRNTYNQIGQGTNQANYNKAVQIKEVATAKQRFYSLGVGGSAWHGMAIAANN